MATRKKASGRTPSREGGSYYLPQVTLVTIKYSLGVSFWCLGDLRIEIYVEFWV